MGKTFLALTKNNYYLQKAFDTIDHNILLQKLKSLGFSPNTVNWFKNYLNNRSFQVCLENNMSALAKLTCSVQQGSILGPLLFLLHVNDMPRSLNKCKLLLYADDSCLLFQSKTLSEIEATLNQDFADLCDWFIDNELSIHFGEDKTKSILFCPKNKVNKLEPLNINYQDIKIHQHAKVTYLGCILDQCLSGEAMALNVLNKINSRLSFLYRKEKFLTPKLKRLLCNALIQPHFDYASLSWYPNLNKMLQKKFQTAQNKCIRFCLQLNPRSHIGIDSFKKINWLPVKDRVEQMVNVNVFKCLNKNSPQYINDIIVLSAHGNNTRNGFLKLNQPSVKSNHGLKSFSYQGPKYWNPLPNDLKRKESVNAFKHGIKQHYFNAKEAEEASIYTKS